MKNLKKFENYDFNPGENPLDRNKRIYLDTLNDLKEKLENLISFIDEGSNYSFTDYKKDVYNLSIKKINSISKDLNFEIFSLMKFVENYKEE